MHKTDQKDKAEQNSEVVSIKDIEHKRVKVLDGLRAFAILFVLINHSTWHFTEEYLTPVILKLGSIDFQNFFYNGWMGVDLFFVLSGFLITSKLLQLPLSKNNVKVYVLRRLFRIVPAYYLVIFLTLIFSILLPDMSANGWSGYDFFSFIKKWDLPVISRMLFMHDYIGGEPPLNGVLWTIAIEMKFYLLLPFLLLLMKKINTPKWQLILISVFYGSYVIGKAALVYKLYGGGDMFYDDYMAMVRKPFHLCLDGLTIGVICAFILSYADTLKSKTTKLNSYIFAAGLTLFTINAFVPYFVGVNTTFFERSAMIPIFALSFGIMLIGLVRGCFASTFFEHKHLRFIAMISYGTYLFHMFAITIHDNLIDILITDLGLPAILCWMIVLPIYIAASMMMAYIVYVLVEKPALDWSKKRFKFDDQG